MAILDRFIPHPKLRQVDRVEVAAPPDRAWPAVRALDVYRIWFARVLFELRTMPEAIAARFAGRPSPHMAHATLDDLARPESHFRILQETERAIAIGAIGKFWKPKIEWAEATSDGFAKLTEPGWAKVAWSIEVDPREGGGSWVSFEVRVTTTDDESQRLFDRYWRLIGPFSHLIRRAGLDLFEDELGTPPGLADRTLPGDEVLAHPRVVREHAIVIDAPPSEVWPWLVQMGCNRAGWYALDRLDNGGRPSALRIHPEWQALAVGDLLDATPGGDGAFGVLAIEPCHALVLGSPSLRPCGPSGPPEPPHRVTWAFVLDPIGDHATRLITRVRAEFEPTLAFYARYGWELVAHEIMQRVQLANLRTRIERLYARRVQAVRGLAERPFARL